MKSEWASIIFLSLILLSIMSVIGKPDILDGIIARANHIECKN